jgi:hypothetical protein
MENENMENAKTFTEACAESQKLSIAKNAKERIVKFLNLNSGFLYGSKRPYRKDANPFTEYQNMEIPAARPIHNDRVFPLETVRIQEFRRKHDFEAEDTVIHTGPFADELARSMNALAVTIATDVYFRNNAYNPESEEGRKLLAHEMTHVSQHNEGRITKTTTRKELEEEAAREENLEEYNPDPAVPVEAGREVVRVRRSLLKVICREVAGDIRGWMEKQKSGLSEQEYLRLLCAYSTWLKRRI